MEAESKPGGGIIIDIGDAAEVAEPTAISFTETCALRPLPELDGRYAVFGRVVDGLDVVDAIEQGDRITKASLGD